MKSTLNLFSRILLIETFKNIINYFTCSNFSRIISLDLKFDRSILTIKELESWFVKEYTCRSVLQMNVTIEHETFYQWWRFGSLIGFEMSSKTIINELELKCQLKSIAISYFQRTTSSAAFSLFLFMLSTYYNILIIAGNLMSASTNFADNVRAVISTSLIS